MKEEHIFPEPPAEKAFAPKGIFLATFFGGPLAGGYMISANYRALNDRRNATKTWIVTIFGTLIILVLSYVISNRSSRHIPGYVFPVIYSTVTYNLVNILQKARLSSHISAGGQFQPTGRIITVTIIGLMTTLFGLLILENVNDFFRQDMAAGY